jgi:acyl carrier protein
MPNDQRISVTVATSWVRWTFEETLLHHGGSAVVREDHDGSTTTGVNRMTEQAPPFSDEELVLREIRALLDQLQLDRDHSLAMGSKLTDDLGVDSLALVELCDQLERTFNVSLPDEVFLVAQTPEQWLDAVVGARDGESFVHGVDESKEATASTSLSARVIAGSERLMSMLAERRSHRKSTGESTSVNSVDAASMLYAVYAWVVLVPFAAAIWSLAVLPMTLTQRRDAGRAVARVTCRALGLSVSVEGDLSLAHGASVIASNHSSFIDGLVLYVFLDESVTFVASSDMEHQFLLGRIMKGFGCVFVDRGRAERSAASVEILVNAIRSGRNVLIFPEGSISERPGLRVFRLGAFETATSSNCAVVPVGIRGSREVLRPGSFRPHPGHVKIAIGVPVFPGGSEFSDRVAMRDQVREVIARLSGQVS